MNRLALRFAPLLVLLMVVLVGGLGLFGRQDPARTASPMMGKVVSFFDMPMVIGDADRFTPNNWQGRIIVLNVFASWCVPCIAEHEALMKLSKSGAAEIHGIAWRDSRDNIMKWLQTRGNPYRMVGLDTSGKSGVALGVMGVPETYVIDSRGRVRYNYRSQLTDEVIQKEIIPLLQKLRSER